MNDRPFDESIGAAGGEFLARVRRSAANVLGDSDVGRAVSDLCDRHAEARRDLLHDRGEGAAVVAVVGATGQGKSWLIRQMISDPVAAAQIRSGDNLNEATERLVWIGPSPPTDLDPRHESFVRCATENMRSLGATYRLVDAPGATDDRAAIAAVARRALSLAGVLILVVRRDQLRSAAVTVLTRASEGAVVVPVVNAIRDEGPQLDVDQESFIARLRAAAPTGQITAAVRVPDFETAGRTEADVSKAATDAIADVLTDHLHDADDPSRRATRLAALDARFRERLHAVLIDHLPDLTGAVGRLNDEARKLPAEIAASLVGSGSSLRAVVRSRLRLSLLSDTAALWFPYRSQLGLLNLTHGAWDRLFLSLSGSLPSLISTVWSSAQSIREGRGAEAELRDGLKRRGAAAVADRLGPLAMRFREEIARLRGDEVPARGEIGDGSDRTSVASLAGIDALQERSQRIFEGEIGRVAPSRFFAATCGLIGTLMFWVLMSGPIISLYSQHFTASYATLRDLGADLNAFPRPDFAMMITVFLLSLLPVAIFSMVVLSITQSRRRVEAAERQIRDAHDRAIETLQRDGVLRLRWDTPLLADAEFLLTAGRGGTADRRG